MVSVSISRSRMWLRLSVPQTTVSTPRVWSSSRFLGLEPGHGAVYAELPLGDLAGHEVVFVRAGHSHKGVAAGDVGGAQSVHADGVAADDRDVQHIGQHPALALHWLDDDDLVVVGQQALSQIPTYTPAAGNTNFIILPHYTNGIDYLARERNTACSVRTVGQMVSSS